MGVRIVIIESMRVDYKLHATYLTTTLDYYTTQFKVYFCPSLGHLFWHLGTAWALFVWWLNFRVRPGDPALPFSYDREVGNICT